VWTKRRPRGGAQANAIRVVDAGAEGLHGAKQRADLVLEPGEELMGEPAEDDTLRWRLGVGTSIRLRSSEFCRGTSSSS
jgi:hypothetical protein